MLARTRRFAALIVGVAAAVFLVGVADAAPSAEAAAGQVSSPIQKGSIGLHLAGQHFGADRGGNPHNGSDYTGITKGVPGTNIHSIMDGTVIATGRGNGKSNSVTVPYTSGLGVVIDHGNVNGQRLYSYYGHLQSYKVSKGDKVQAGQHIAEMGGSGPNGASDFAVHLHLSIFVNTTRPVALSTFHNPHTWLANKGITPGKTTPITPGDTTPPPTGSWPDAALPITGTHTGASHAAWVQLMGDIGYKNSSLTVNIQNWLKAKGYYKGAVDGKFGSMTVKALQSLLKDRGFYTGVIDGDRGSLTVKAEIRFLNDQRKFY